MSNKNIHISGTRFEVVCKRCSTKFTVIRNWGPATCPQCGSRQLEVW